MREMKVTVVVAVAGMAMASFAGCGSDDGEGSISRDDYVAQGNAICESGQEEINRQADDHDVETAELAELEAFLTDVSLPLIRDQIDDLRELGYPEGDREELESIYDDAEEILDETEENPVMVLEADGDPLHDVNRRLADYGLDECG